MSLSVREGQRVGLSSWCEVFDLTVHSSQKYSLKGCWSYKNLEAVSQDGSLGTTHPPFCLGRELS